MANFINYDLDDIVSRVLNDLELVGLKRIDYEEDYTSLSIFNPHLEIAHNEAFKVFFNEGCNQFIVVLSSPSAIHGLILPEYFSSLSDALKICDHYNNLIK